MIGRDIINYDYILKLIIAFANTAEGAEKEKKKEDILKKVEVGISSNGVPMKKKKDLIEQFIAENLPNIHNNGGVEKEFEIFWDKEKRAAMIEITEGESINPEAFESIIAQYLYTDRLPRREEVLKLKEGVKLTERTTVFEHIKHRIVDFVERFEW